jgi:formylglycine-generating enzyme required for sulfatase activity
MRISSVVLLLFAMSGCGSGTQPEKLSAESSGHKAQQPKVASPEKQVATPATKAPTEEPVAEKPVAAKPSALKPSAETPSTAKTPDVATVKKAITPAQLELGEPITNSIGMVLVPIPAGEFMMGSPDSDKDAANHEKPQHLVKITKPFYLGVHQVTQEAYKLVMGDNPSHFQGDDRRPVENVAWTKAVNFCNRLSDQEGLDLYYKIDGQGVSIIGGSGYRLPTEAEWEYACRAGTTTKWSSGNQEIDLEEVCWFSKNSSMKTHAVGALVPNDLGLYDMHGNVLEWCWDWFGKYSKETLDDPIGPASGSRRVWRGGSFIYETDICRSAFRSSWLPDIQNYLIGFRVSRTYN